MRRSDSNAPWRSSLPQAVELPSSDQQLLEPLNDAVEGGTAPGALGAAVLDGGLLGEWALGLRVANALVAGCFGPRGEFRERQGKD